jgi:hypothetical protein
MMNWNKKRFVLTKVCLLTFTAFALKAQTPKEKFHLTKEAVAPKHEELKEKIGTNLECPSEYELAALVALSAYPELQNKDIEFVFARGAYSMAARPVPRTLFKHREKRKYRIFINTQSRNQGLLLHQIPFNAQVGIITHELAHILYYTRVSSLRIIRDGISYSSKKFRAEFEKETDLEAIRRGFGWQLYEFASRTMEDENIPEEYKIYKSQIYLTPESIIEHILQTAEAEVEEESEIEGES